jgi:hypothetical protein
MMRRLKLIVAMGAVFMLAGCFDSTPKLSQEEEKLLEAVTYLFTGLEDNLDDTDAKGMPWQRTVKGRNLEYWRVSKNGIYSSDDAENKKMRKSTYVRYIYRLTSPDPCVFSFSDITEFSQGDSQEDFSAMSSTNMLNTQTFNLANAHTFVFEDDGYGTPYIRIVGPRAMCYGPNACENAWNSVFSGLSLGRFRNDERFERRQKAYAFVKKACPGKEF